MFAITRGRLAAAALGLSAAVASAQAPLLYGPVAGCAAGNCASASHGTYGPALFAVNPPQGRLNKLAGPDEPGCVGRSSYPLSDWAYIRQFCGPTLHPGTCHGYYPTKWRKWDESCPGGVCGSAGVEVAAPAPLLIAPPGPITPVPLPSEPLPPPKEAMPKPDAPKPVVPKVEPVTPPKVPLIPKDTNAVPTIPNVPMRMPTEPGKINTTEVNSPAPMSTLVPPTPEPRQVVPPDRK
jgi:hypothetical protein